MTTDQDSELTRAIVEQMADAAIYADVQGVIRIWNAAATAVFGFSATDAIGQSLDLIVPENLRKAHWAGFDRSISTGVTRLGGHATITRALHKSGKKIYVEMSFAVVRGPARSAIGSVAIARDATARYEEEKARRRPS